jgi:L-iditol 2-dehydrogenase
MCRAFKESNLDPGGFAEFVRVPAPNVRHATFRVPDHLTDEEATFVEPLACCLRAVERARVQPGDTAVVIGLGSIGCLFVQLLRRAGAQVIGADPLAARTELAARFGAHGTADAEAVAAGVRAVSDGRGADHVIITGGGAAVLPQAAALVRDGGAIHYFAGGGGAALPLPLATLYHRELTITTTYSSSPGTLARAFWLLASGKVDVEPLMTHRVPLERLGDGVALMQRREAVKVYVTP